MPGTRDRRFSRAVTIAFAFTVAACASGGHDFGPAPTTFPADARAVCASATVLSPSDDLSARGTLGIVFEDQTGEALRLAGMRIKLDDTGLCEADTDSDPFPGAIPVGYGSVTAGEHSVSVALEVRGHGEAFFAYLKGYHFRVVGSRRIAVAAGQRKRLRIILFERGGATTPLGQRLALHFIEEVMASPRATE